MSLHYMHLFNMSDLEDTNNCPLIILLIRLLIFSFLYLWLKAVIESGIDCGCGITP